jgi:hypothetical protein
MVVHSHLMVVHSHLMVVHSHLNVVHSQSMLVHFTHRCCQFTPMLVDSPYSIKITQRQGVSMSSLCATLLILSGYLWQARCELSHRIHTDPHRIHTDQNGIHADQNNLHTDPHRTHTGQNKIHTDPHRTHTELTEFTQNSDGSQRIYTEFKPINGAVNLGKCEQIQSRCPYLNMRHATMRHVCSLALEIETPLAWHICNTTRASTTTCVTLL